MIDVPILYLSSYIIDNKPEYYRLLNQTNRSGQWEEWILFMLKAVEKRDHFIFLWRMKRLSINFSYSVQEETNIRYPSQSCPEAFKFCIE